MSRAQLALCIFYGITALAALIATWSQNLSYFGGGGSGAAWQFMLDTKVNPASRSITVDIAFFLLAAVGFMVTEARKLGVRFVWAYVAFGFFLAISVAFPVFMIAREMLLHRAGGSVAGVKLKASDVIGLFVVTGLTLGLVLFVLS